MTIQIISEDDHLLVVDKPPGLATQAPPQYDSLESRVRDYLRNKATGKRGYLGVPHRLDRCVGGVIVFAKHRTDARRVAEQFQQRSVQKEYLAYVAGQPSVEDRWQDHIRKVPDQPRAEIVAADADDAKQAVLEYQRDAAFRDADGAPFAALRIRLHTGRMHQIRLQAAHRGHPIVGDRMYGSQCDWGPVADERARQIALTATTLRLQHPRSRQPVEFRALSSLRPPAGWTPVDVHEQT